MLTGKLLSFFHFILFFTSKHASHCNLLEVGKCNNLLFLMAYFIALFLLFSSAKEEILKHFNHSVITKKVALFALFSQFLQSGFKHDYN